jgi:hypothetical protein
MLRRLSVHGALAIAIVTSAASTARAFTEADVESGRRVFGRCARCHELQNYPRPSETTANVPLSGTDARFRLRERARTAAALADLVRAQMPVDQPKSLTESESFAVTAFILSTNGVPADGKPTTRESMAALELDQALMTHAHAQRWHWAAYGGAALGVVLVGWHLVGWRSLRRQQADKSRGPTQ